jgi:hypothetical protein
VRQLEDARNSRKPVLEIAPMKSFSRFAPLSIFALAVALGIAGCHGNNQNASADTQNMSQDPADANLAPASDTTTPAAPAASSAQTTPASYESTPEDTGEQPVASAPQPPPALPEYSQPPCPGDGYIWTPGYWNYEPTGYFWVPGVWTHAPYVGALWTPPYWGFSRGAYVLFPGHWGLHIGFYGGINYGFGYTGLGYQGGYWHGNQFAYNRTVNNINTTVIHNVYAYNIVNRTTVVNRVSYNGGPGGIAVRPRPQELVTVREARAPRMSTQIQHVEMARTDHNQFVAVNHGRPAAPVVERPLEADRDVKPEVRPVPHAEEHPPAARGARPAERRPPARPEDRRK